MGAIAIINIEEAVVSRGQRAWCKIKATAAEQRQLWREVGEALSYGRLANTSDQKFSRWCTDKGFIFSTNPRTSANMRGAAVWLASHWEKVHEAGAPEGMTSPTELREWFNKQEKGSDTPEDLRNAPITTKVVPDMDTRTAEKVGKLARRAAASCSP